MPIFGVGVFIGFVAAIMIAPDNTKIVEVYPQNYYKEVDISESVCKGPFDATYVVQKAESRRIVDLD